MPDIWPQLTFELNPVTFCLISVMLGFTGGVAAWAITTRSAKGQPHCRRCWYILIDGQRDDDDSNEDEDEVKDKSRSEAIDGEQRPLRTTCPECGHDNSRYRNLKAPKRYPKIIAGYTLVCSIPLLILTIAYIDNWLVRMPLQAGGVEVEFHSYVEVFPFSYESDLGDGDAYYNWFCRPTSVTFKGGLPDYDALTPHDRIDYVVIADATIDVNDLSALDALGHVDRIWFTNVTFIGSSSPTSTHTWANGLTIISFDRCQIENEQQLSFLADATTLHMLFVRDSAVGNDIVPFIAKHPQIYRLEFHNTNVNPGGIAPLAGNLTIHTLDVTAAPLPDHARPDDLSPVDLAPYAKLLNLSWVDLSHQPVTDEGLTHLAKLPITNLSLNYTNIRGSGLKHLAEHDLGFGIYLEGTLLTEGGLNVFADDPTMTSLHLKHATVRRDDLSLAMRAPNLSHIYLQHATLTGEQPLDFSKLQRSDDRGDGVTLYLDNSNVRDIDLQSLGDTQVSTIDLSNTSITDAGLVHLCRMPRLTELQLSNTHISKASIDMLVNMQQLKTLRLPGAIVDDQAAAKLSTLPQLQVLDLSGSMITDEGLKMLRPLDARWRLELSGTNITDAGLANLAHLDVTQINLDGTKLTGQGLEHLAKMPQLTHIWLQNTNVTLDSLEPLGKLPYLQHLDLTGTPAAEEMDRAPRWLDRAGYVEPPEE